ncbi:MAG: alpha/beta-hydrolase family protein [Gordonia sp. (in: high G+C Gram-positive bacteria)]|uniref:alpha/beta-hydrolase family protein n=1 Tax=Gordonia sp. (in: high G+C Gram-positive bacteria) TaxID=84139 RepID=UPI003C762D06
MNWLRVPPSVAFGALVGRLLALSPGMLPRSVLVATAAGSVLTVIGMGVGGAIGSGMNRIWRRRPTCVHPLWIAAGLMTVSVALGFAVRHEIAVRSTVGVPAIGPWWVLTVWLIPLATATGVAAAVQVPRRRLVGLGLVGLVIATFLVPGSAAQATTADRPDRSDLLYSALSEPGSFQVRADRLVERWVARGGLTQRAVALVVPTGSGWVDASSIEGLSRQFGGSVRSLALQYDNVPSWRAFVSAPDRAGDATVALLSRLWEEATRVPASQRPRIYLVGQSLGAVGADAAREWARSAKVDVAGTILTGPPAGTIRALAACERRVIVANHDDPVPGFALSLLWRPTPRADGEHRAWLPAVSATATVLDLVGSLDVPTGHGHRYGIEQGSALTRMPAGCIDRSEKSEVPR